MELQEIRAELSMKVIEFEQALNNGIAHNDLIKIYRELKELQYKRLLAELKQPQSFSDEIVLE